MPPDTVQLGSWTISKALFDVIAPLLSGLIGTLTGGLITFLVTRATEDRKWQREIRYKAQEERREAIAIALEWIAPLEQALTKASLISNSFQFGRIDQQRFLGDYPDVISRLTKLDPPARLRVFLPKDAYSISFEVIDGLEQLKHLSFDGLETFKACSDLVTSLREKVQKLQTYLEEEYRKTFNQPA